MATEDRYTELFATAFDEEVNEKSDEVAPMIDAIFKIGGLVTQLNEDTHIPSLRYVLDINEEVARDIADGVIKLTKNKEGKVFAQISENGKFGSKIPIKKELIEKASDPALAFTQLQMQALQHQMQEIVEVLKEIQYEVKNITISLHDDRVALLDSGKCLILESEKIIDEQCKKMTLSYAQSQLSLAASQIQRETTREILQLIEGSYPSKIGNRSKEIAKRMKKVETNLAHIHEVYIEKAKGYLLIDEKAAFIEVLLEYSAFLRQSIAGNAKPLAELDPGIKYFDGSVWDQRTKSIEALENFKASDSLTSTVFIAQIEE